MREWSVTLEQRAGFMTYVSNSERTDMIKSLRELIATLEAGEINPPVREHH